MAEKSSDLPPPTRESLIHSLSFGSVVEVRHDESDVDAKRQAVIGIVSIGIESVNLGDDNKFGGTGSSLFEHITAVTGEVLSEETLAKGFTDFFRPTDPSWAENQVAAAKAEFIESQNRLQD